jgi:hypothetical protein
MTILVNRFFFLVVICYNGARLLSSVVSENKAFHIVLKHEVLFCISDHLVFSTSCKIFKEVDGAL